MALSNKKKQAWILRKLYQMSLCIVKKRFLKCFGFWFFGYLKITGMGGSNLFK